VDLTLFICEYFPQEKYILQDVSSFIFECLFVLQLVKEDETNE